MIRTLLRLSTGFALLWSAAAHAQQAEPQSFPFAGGTLTIAENEDFEKVLAFDGRELARNYVMFHDRSVTLGEDEVMLFASGDGGNACGAATVIVWKPTDAPIASQIVGEDCGAPPAAATGDSLYFVPYLVPGASAAVEVWSPARGLRIAGMLSFAPQPGTGWADLDPSGFETIIDAFSNEAVYKAAGRLLGASMSDFVTGLLVSGGMETTVDGVFYASGCVPHACGSADSFMAVDPSGRKLYFAQMGERPEPDAWPALKSWPPAIRSAMRAALQPR
jgi:hypothetical protein